MPERETYEIGAYRFEPFNARLVRSGKVLPLTAKAVGTLLELARRPDELVSKDELMAAVWPGIAVEENNLNQQISALRKALSGGQETVVIQTVPRLGYRLVAPVRRLDSGGDERVATRVSVAASAPPAIHGREDEPTAGRRRRVLVPLAGAAAILALGVAWFSGALDPASARARRQSEEARLKGEELHRQGNAEGAIKELQRAIALDPTNARPHGSLAHALNASTRIQPSSAVRPAGRSPSVEAARRGAELDPSCGVCKGTYAFFSFYHDWRFAEAEDLFVQAIRLSPESLSIRPSYAMLLAVTGRPTPALEQVDLALAAQPFQTSWLMIRTTSLYFARRYDEAVAAADRMLAVASSDEGAWEWRSKALFQLGRGREAVHALAQVSFAEQSAELERIVKDGGVDAALRKLLEYTDDWRGRVEHAWRRAGWRAILGDTDGALDDLRRAIEARRFNAINLGVDPVYDRMRDDLRFRELLHLVGLEKYF